MHLVTECQPGGLRYIEGFAEVSHRVYLTVYVFFM